METWELLRYSMCRVVYWSQQSLYNRLRQRDVWSEAGSLFHFIIDSLIIKILVVTGVIMRSEMGISSVFNIIIVTYYLWWQTVLGTKFAPLHCFHLGIHVGWHRCQHVIRRRWISEMRRNIILDLWSYIRLMVSFVVVDGFEFCLLICFWIKF